MSDEADRSKSIPLHLDAEGPLDLIPRRAALQVLLGGAAGFALPAVAEAQHPMHQHLANPAVIEQAQQRAAVTAYPPVFLDDHQSKTLEVLAEAIVPGSTGARVGPFLDQLLAVDSAANQRAFLGALGAFDMAAINRHGKTWIGDHLVTAGRAAAGGVHGGRQDVGPAAATSRISRTGSPARITRRRPACASSDGRATSSISSCPGARTPAATRTDRASEDHQCRRPDST